jgi:hypothetical protein
MISKKVGRTKTDYTRALGEEICTKIACSSKGIKALCKLNEHWPSHKTIYGWINIHKEFSELYARAKQYQIEVLVDEILSIADDTSNDYTTSEDGRIVVNHEHIQRSKVRIDTQKWLASKLCPRLYGDRVQHEGTVGIKHSDALKELE